MDETAGDREGELAPERPEAVPPSRRLLPRLSGFPGEGYQQEDIDTRELESATVAGLLELQGLTRRYGTLTALDDLTFSVPAGQVVGFLGPNGAGKTTTMRAVFGLTDLDAGTVKWNGLPVGQAERRRFGYMPEERGLYPAMLVGEQLEYLGRLHGMSALGRPRRYGGVAGTVGDRRPGPQQGGCAVAWEPAASATRRRLASRPGAADPRRTARRAGPDGHRRHRRGAHRAGRAGCCVLFSSHQLDQVEDLCESVTIIDHGRLVVTGTVDDLAQSGPRRLVVRVDGDRDASWAQGIPGITLSEVDAGAARLVLDPSVDSEMVLRSAMAAGRVTEFVFRTSAVVRGLQGGVEVGRRPHCGLRGNRPDRETAEPKQAPSRPSRPASRRVRTLQRRCEPCGGPRDARAVSREDLPGRNLAHPGGGGGGHRDPHAQQGQATASTGRRGRVFAGTAAGGRRVFCQDVATTVQFVPVTDAAVRSAPTCGRDAL